MNPNSFIESVSFDGTQIALLSSGDNTEVIYHKLDPGVRWAIEPQEGWTALEHLTILSGELKFVNRSTSLKAGDSFSRCPVKEHYVFQSIGTTEFIYVTSQPIFQHYSKAALSLRDLAVTIEDKDGYTKEHCSRICRLSMRVGEFFSLNSDQLVRLNWAAFLHDIGKVRVPLEILQKPGSLTNEEWDIMKKHTTFGKELLEESGLALLKNVGKIIEQHHERYDGNGYPHGLKEEEISIEASIISVVDAFDAMTTDRVYKKAISREEALIELEKCKGTQFHPQVVDIFKYVQSQS